MTSRTSSLPRVNTSLSPDAPCSRNRAERASLTPQTDLSEAPPIPLIGGFALKAIAHIKPPKTLVRS